MRLLGYLMAALLALGMAFWAYQENYETQSRIADMTRLRNEIAQLRESLGLLRAEWAWLNRPERLHELVDLNFDRLQLIPLTPDQFIAIPQIGFPDPVDPQLPPGADPAEDMLIGAGEAGDEVRGQVSAGAVVPRPPTRPTNEVSP